MIMIISSNKLMYHRTGTWPSAAPGTNCSRAKVRGPCQGGGARLWERQRNASIIVIIIIIIISSSSSSSSSSIATIDNVIIIIIIITARHFVPRQPLMGGILGVIRFIL